MGGRHIDVHVRVSPSCYQALTMANIISAFGIAIGFGLIGALLYGLGWLAGAVWAEDRTADFPRWFRWVFMVQTNEKPSKTRTDGRPR